MPKPKSVWIGGFNFSETKTQYGSASIARVTFETCANSMMTSLKWHLQLGGTRLRQVQVCLADESKLSVYREVAEEALRDGDRRAAIDVGLPAEERVADSKGATCLDVSGGKDPSR